jgi:HlyD family secretion protein
LRLQRADAEARVKQAKAALEQARAQAKRDELRQKEVEAARAALEDARTRLKLAEANRVQLPMRQKEVQQAQATVEQLQSALKEARTRLADTIIRAPMSGVVTQRYIESGELVTSGVATFSTGMPLVQIADLSRMRIKLQVNEVDIGKVKVGQKVEIRLDALRDEVFEGRVRKVAPASAAPQQGAPGGAVIKFPVEVEIERPDPRMKPGMSAKCRIIVERRENVVRLPKEALQFVDASYRESERRAPPDGQRQAGGQKRDAHGEGGLARRCLCGDTGRAEGGREGAPAAVHRSQAPAV